MGRNKKTSPVNMMVPKPFVTNQKKLDFRVLIFKLHCQQLFRLLKSEIRQGSKIAQATYGLCAMALQGADVV